MAIPSIQPAEVQARIQRGERVDLIDVRSALEWNGGHAVGARHVPLGSLDPAAVMASRVGAAEDPIYLICASGGRSAAACEAFHRAGFTQAVNVAGGTSAWSRAGLPVERDARAAAAGLLRQGAILALVAGVVLFLMPCSPLSLYGNAFCPTASAAEPAAAAAPEVDFARDVAVASAAQPVLVDFHAGWCPPCRKLGPELEALARERGAGLRLVPIDVDRHPQLAAEHGVNGIPDVRLWRDGREVARFTGYRPKAEIAAWIDAAAKL